MDLQLRLELNTLKPEPVATRASSFTHSNEEVKTITLKMPYHINHVHVYLTECPEGLVLFDTGPPLAGAVQCLRKNIDFSRLRYVFITHGHIDHCGLAGFLQRETNADIILSRSTVTQLSDKKTHICNLIAILTNLGFSNKTARLLADKASHINRLPTVPQQYLLAEESGELLNSLGITALPCPWHSQGDLIYLLRDCAFLGDVAVRGMFPVPLLDVDCIDLKPSRFNNYEAFCTSIDNLKKIQEKTMLPGHNNYLTDLDGWICFMVSNILGRAHKLLPFYEQQDNIYLAVRQFICPQEWNPVMIYVKTSELVFIYDFLKKPEKLRKILQQYDLYQRIEQQFSLLPAHNY